MLWRLLDVLKRAVEDCAQHGAASIAQASGWRFAGRSLQMLESVWLASGLAVVCRKITSRKACKLDSSVFNHWPALIISLFP